MTFVTQRFAIDCNRSTQSIKLKNAALNNSPRKRKLLTCENFTGAATFEQTKLLKPLSKDKSLKSCWTLEH